MGIKDNINDFRKAYPAIFWILIVLMILISLIIVIGIIIGSIVVAPWLIFAIKFVAVAIIGFLILILVPIEL